MKNFKFLLLKAGLGSATTDATVEHPLEHRGKKNGRCAKDQYDSAVQSTDRQSHPPPPERELVRHYPARHFECEYHSIYPTGAK
jgi:hypothetical protein